MRKSSVKLGVAGILAIFITISVFFMLPGHAQENNFSERTQDSDKNCYIDEKGIETCYLSEYLEKRYVNYNGSRELFTDVTDLTRQGQGDSLIFTAKGHSVTVQPLFEYKGNNYRIADLKAYGGYINYSIEKLPKKWVFHWNIKIPNISGWETFRDTVKIKLNTTTDFPIKKSKDSFAFDTIIFNARALKNTCTYHTFEATEERYNYSDCLNWTILYDDFEENMTICSEYSTYNITVNKTLDNCFHLNLDKVSPNNVIVEITKNWSFFNIGDWIDLDPEFYDNDTTWDSGTFDQTRNDGENVTLENRTSLPCTPSEVIPDVTNHYSTVDNGDGTWTTTFQPNETFSKDTFSLHTTNKTYGERETIQTGQNDQYGMKYRAWIQFNLSVIPSSATVDSAFLRLTVSNDGRSTYDTTVEVYRMIQWWNEDGTENPCTDGANWATYNCTDEWQTYGADGANDREQTNTGSLTITDKADGYYLGWVFNWTLNATRIEEMINGTWSNEGFVLRDTDDVKDAYVYYSSSATTAEDRPKLEINYTPNCYYDSGNYTSRIFDAGESVTWDEIAWDSTEASGTDINISVQDCDDSACSGDAWDETCTSSPCTINDTTLENQWFRYRAFFTTNDTANTPYLEGVNITYSTAVVGIQFTITLIDGTESEASESGNTTAKDIDFNVSASTEANVTPYVEATQQTTLLEIINFTNDGSGPVQWLVSLNDSIPSTIVLFATLTGNQADTPRYINSTSNLTVNASIGAGKVEELWLWVNTSSSSVNDNRSRDLIHYSIDA